MAHLRIIVVPLLLALAGCKLIDQTTFAPDPEPDQVAITAGASAPSLPASTLALISVRYDTPAPAFEDKLAFAIRAAEQRRPGGEYDVISVSTAADAAQASRDAATIMEAMAKLGVAPARIHLGARIDPAQGVREVGVHLR